MLQENLNINNVQRPVPIQARPDNRSIEQILELMQDGRWIVPDYQRGNRVWSRENQSAFIESVLIGLPIPAIFVAKHSGNLGSRCCEIIDGLQRVTAMQKFVGGKLHLKSLELLPEFNGFRFDDLPDNAKDHLLGTTIHVYEVPKSSLFGDTGRLLFDRLNRSSSLSQGERFNYVLGSPRLIELVSIVREYVSLDDRRFNDYVIATAAIAGSITKYDVQSGEFVFPDGSRYRYNVGGNGARGNTQFGHFMLKVGHFIQKMSEDEFKAFKISHKAACAQVKAHWGSQACVSTDSRNSRKNATVAIAQFQLVAFDRSFTTTATIWRKFVERNTSPWVSSHLPKLICQLTLLNASAGHNAGQTF